jgi:hypothetical protein
VLVEQGDRESGLVPETAEERALADSRGGRDLVHRDGRDAVLTEQTGCCLEHSGAVAGGIGPLFRLHGISGSQSPTVPVTN